VTIRLARRRGLIGERAATSAVDATGLESRHCSAYYVRRQRGREGHFGHRWPKLSAVVDVSTHLILGAVVDRGPKGDDIEFQRVVRQAHRRHPFDDLLADAGYDAEDHHRFLHDELGVTGIIPPIRGRPSNDPNHLPGGPHRRALAEDWPADLYGQRWQVETDFSMLKRLLGSAVRSRRDDAIDGEILLRVLTINLMIIWRLYTKRSFQQSIPGTFFMARRAPLAYHGRRSRKGEKP